MSGLRDANRRLARQISIQEGAIASLRAETRRLHETEECRDRFLSGVAAQLERANADVARLSLCDDGGARLGRASVKRALSRGVDGVFEIADGVEDEETGDEGVFEPVLNAQMGGRAVSDVRAEGSCGLDVVRVANQGRGNGGMAPRQVSDMCLVTADALLDVDEVREGGVGDVGGVDLFDDGRVGDGKEGRLYARGGCSIDVGEAKVVRECEVEGDVKDEIVSECTFAQLEGCAVSEDGAEQVMTKQVEDEMEDEMEDEDEWIEKKERKFSVLYKPKLAMTAIVGLDDSPFVRRGFNFKCLGDAAFAHESDGTGVVPFDMIMNDGFESEVDGRQCNVWYVGVSYTDGTTLMYVPIDGVRIVYRSDVGVLRRAGEDGTYGADFVVIEMAEVVYDRLVDMATCAFKEKRLENCEEGRVERRDDGTVRVRCCIEEADGVLEKGGRQMNVEDVLVESGEDLCGRVLLYMRFCNDVDDDEHESLLDFKFHAMEI